MPHAFHRDVLNQQWHRTAVVALCIALSGCADVPGLQGSAADLPSPSLVPVDPFLVEADRLAAADDSTSGLDARAAALRAKAAQLRRQ